MLAKDGELVTVVFIVLPRFFVLRAQGAVGRNQIVLIIPFVLALRLPNRCDSVDKFPPEVAFFWGEVGFNNIYVLVGVLWCVVL